MDTFTINKDLNQLYIELEEVARMPFKAVCKKYNSDSKNEIIAGLQAEIESLQNKLNEITSDEEDYDVFDDHGFANERDFNRWKHGA